MVPHKDEIGACFGGRCREIAVEHGASGAVTDGTYVAVDFDGNTEVYRAVDGVHLYRTQSYRASAFLDDVLLADGADCSGPSRRSPTTRRPGRAVCALHVGSSRWDHDGVGR